MSKVVPYLRVSTDDQRISPEVQRDQCFAWFTYESRPGGSVEGFTYSKELQDHGVSGKIPLFRRPQGQHLLTELDRGDVLIVSKLSRAFRNTIDCLNSLEAFGELGIRVVMLDAQVDTMGKYGKMMITMIALLAELERELISERTCEALANRMSQGQWVGHAPPGWRVLPKHERRSKDNLLVPDPGVRKLAKYAAREIAKGRPVETVANEVSHREENITTHRRKHHQGKWFTPRSIVTMAVYSIVGFPPLTRTKLKRALGGDPFTVAFVREHHGKNCDEVIARVQQELPVTT